MNLKTTTVVLASLCLAWLVGCTDVPSTGPTPPEFNSEFRFVNAASDLGEISITVDLGPSVSGLGFMSASSHQTYPSGNRVAELSSGDSLRIAMTSEQRATVMILPLTGQIREFVKLVERRIFDSATTSSGGRLRVAHAVASTDDTGATVPGPDVDVSVSSVDTAFTIEGLEYAASSGYIRVPTGEYSLSTIVTGDTTATVIAEANITVSNSRATSILAGNEGGSVAWINLQDN